MWRLVGVVILIWGLAFGVARVLRAQEQSGGVAQRQQELRTQAQQAFEVIEGRVDVLEGYLLKSATAPFTCDATHVGAYVDTTCNQLCICLPSAAKWGRSDTGVLGTSTNCCA